MLEVAIPRELFSVIPNPIVEQFGADVWFHDRNIGRVDAPRWRSHLNASLSDQPLPDARFGLAKVARVHRLRSQPQSTRSWKSRRWSNHSRRKAWPLNKPTGNICHQYLVRRRCPFRPRRSFHCQSTLPCAGSADQAHRSWQWQPNCLCSDCICRQYWNTCRWKCQSHPRWSSHFQPRLPCDQIVQRVHWWRSCPSSC